VRGLEFDINEMAITTYICAKEHGKPFTALPIFLVRAFHHVAIGVEINHPNVEPLIPDAAEAGFAALRRHGHYPINHTLVVKDELLRA
jgi:4,5-dihydroxyphthalate decarboxylase